MKPAIADDIDLMDSSNDEFQDLTKRLVERAKANGMEVSTEKNKIMTNSTNKSSADVSMNSQKLDEVTSLKYLAATMCKGGTCSAEVSMRIALSDGSNGQTNQDLAVQTPSALQASLCSCHFHPPPQL